MKKNLFLFLLVFIYVPVFSQQKMLSMQDAMVNNRGSLAVQNLKGLQFYNNDKIVYIKKTDKGEAWVVQNLKDNREMELFTLGEINGMLQKANIDTLKNIPNLKYNKDNFVLSMKGGSYQLDPRSKTIRLLQSSEVLSRTNLEEGKAGYLAYLKDNDLYVSKGDNAQRITTDGSDAIVYASSVHQSEFGIVKGTFWSNAGTRLAFYRMDQHMVPNYPIVNWEPIPATVTNVRYPMAGDSSHHVTVGIYDAASNTTRYLNTGLPAEQYLTNIAWSPDDAFLYIAVVNRAQNHMWLRQFDATTGAYIKTLFEETDDKYTEPLVPMLFVKNNPNQFIWQSRRDGWNHLYLYNKDGQLIKQLTKGNWEVTEVKGFDDKGENLFYMSTTVSPLSRNLYKVNLKTVATTALTNDDAVHSTTVSDDGKFYIDSYSKVEAARTIQIKNMATGKANVIFSAPDPLADYAKGEMKLFSIKASTGEDLNCRLFYPIGFDPTKKYPVIVYWYGGPHAQLITNGYNGGAGDYWFQYMAERGYLVFSLDTRGSAYRGKTFEQYIFREAGKAQMEDMEIGVRYLKTLPFADTDHMGLFGWSYGGFMTTNFVLNHPGVFKAAVAGGPVIDWREYEIMYGERYMDRPQDNAEGYKKTNLILQAGKLKDKLLLIHGMQDPVVLQQHSVRFVKAATDAGVQVDYMIYPGHEHNVLGKDRAVLYQKVTDYLTENIH